LEKSFSFSHLFSLFNLYHIWLAKELFFSFPEKQDHARHGANQKTQGAGKDGYDKKCGMKNFQ